jgi:hypothetical protein
MFKECQMDTSTFIIECPFCKAKVAAIEAGSMLRSGVDDDAGEPYGCRIQIGSCPRCSSFLVGESTQTGFAGFDADQDEWSDVIRIHPRPTRKFASWRIPRPVSGSLDEASRCLQVGANTAACVMLGRALEGLCQDVLKSAKPTVGKSAAAPNKRVMLGTGIQKLKEMKVIDERLYDWSQQLRAFRNLAAHPEDISISREDADDLQAFVHAIVEYVYDLTDRYEEFKERVAKRDNKRAKAKAFAKTSAKEVPDLV